MRKSKIRSSSFGSGINRNLFLVFSSRQASFLVALLALALGPLSNFISSGAGRAQSDQVSESALAQIQSLIEQKLKRTPAQQKLDSNLLTAARLARGEQVSANAPSLQPDVKIEADGRVMVDIDATVTEELLEQIKAGGGDVVTSFPKYGAIRARVSLSRVETLAGLASVRQVRRAVERQLNQASQEESARQMSLSNAQPLHLAQRADRMRSILPQSLSALAAQKKKTGRNQIGPLIGSQTSQGDIAHSAADARSIFFVNGTGVKIGVLADSFNNLGGADFDVSTGDLPGPGNPNGFTTPVTVLQDAGVGGRDEGRAMLQIVHDLAPGASLYFVTTGFSPASFVTNIQALRDAGCAIIIDGVFFPDEPPFQDGLVAQAVNSATAAGVLYVSAAGNSGNLTHNSSGAWEGDFNDSGVNLIVGGNSVGRLHLFSGGNTLNSVTSGSSASRADLFWSDALGQSGNDYDLYVLDSGGTNVVRMSDTNQTGTQDPYEFVGTLNVGEKIAIVKFSGAARALNLTTGRGTKLQFGTSGQIRGHSCASDALAIAAVSAQAGGEFFGGIDTHVENFSSDGVRRVFYNVNGTAITPGNLLFATNGGAVRQKPDFTAADGVDTTLASATGLNPFFGTSAAAAHAGAIAGLVLSFDQLTSANRIRAILTRTALDIEVPGIDRDSGWGIVMARRALEIAATLDGDTIGVYDGSSRTFYLRNSNTPGFSENTIIYGPATAIPIVGDWDGNGTTTIGVYDPSTQTFYLRNSNNQGFANITLKFGPPGAIPVVGDWNADGVDTIGVYDPSSRTFYLRNSNTLGFADLQIQYGPSGAMPIVGDWDGNGTTTIGVYEPGTQTFYLRNSNTPGNADLQVPYGPAGSIPIVGDWDNNGTVTIGVYDSTQTFYLRNSNSIGPADIQFRFGPPGAKPIAGDWEF